MLSKFFTFWIFIWCILYILKLVNSNPSIFLLIVNICNICFVSILWNHVNNIILSEIIIIDIIFIILQIIIKFKITYNDIIFGITLFIIYNIYIYLMYEKKIHEIYIQHMDDRKKNKSIFM